MTSSPDLAAALAEQLARYLTDVVICPGSRNSPLSLALLARPDIRVHSRIDERSAAFLALGMARVTSRFVGVVTTSGTAVANCLPAVVEAKYSHTPLVIISADRPAELVGTGANQTIEQRGLLGVETVEVTELSDVESLDFTSLVMHINVRFAEPLVNGLPTVVQPVAKLPAPRFYVDHGAVTVDLSRRTLVIAGDEAWRVEGLEDVPTIAEPSAPAPYQPVHPLAAAIFSKQQVSAEGYVVDTKPEQLIIIGHPTLHRVVIGLAQDEDIDLIVLSRTEQVTNPWRRKATVATRVAVTGSPSAEWLKICQAAGELAITTVREVLADPQYGFSGLHVAAAVADSLVTGDTFFVGASNPVRDVSLCGLPFDAVDTFSPRGAAGIDGNNSQAIGIALAVQAREPELLRAPRTVALVGDVTFLHDLGGLLIPETAIRPENLTIVVSNDDGGGIFETLEVGAKEYKPSFEHAFGTPHGVDLSELCRGYGVDYVKVEALDDLLTALEQTTDDAGFTVIEVRCSRQHRRVMHEALKTGF